MRLSISMLELEGGSSIQEGTKDRMLEISHLCMGRELVAITPVTITGRTTAAVLLTEDGEGSGDRGTKIKVKFRPIWCKVFRLCSMKKNEITALVLEVDDGKKYWIDNTGVKECTFTTKGPGTDPIVVKDSEITLGELLAEDNSNYIVRTMTGFIRRRF